MDDPESPTVGARKTAAGFGGDEAPTNSDSVRRMSTGSDASLAADEIDKLQAGALDLNESSEDVIQDGKTGPFWTGLRIAALVIGLPALLYVFIISLGLMGEAFKIIGAKGSGSTFSDDIVSNPIGGLMCGILATVLVQSSSSTTSVVVAMTASGFVTPEQAIFMVMGANIGTSVTSTIVALFSAFNKKQFTRAFAAGTMHDFINLLDVLVFFPTEVAFHWLDHLTEALTKDMAEESEKGDKAEFIKKLTKPVLSEITTHIGKDVMKLEACLANTDDPATCADGQAKVDKNGGRVVKTFFGSEDPGISDQAVGVICLLLSLVVLLITLVLIVKLLHFCLKGMVGKGLRWALNFEIPFNKDVHLGKKTVNLNLRWVSDYFLVIVGTGFTILVQSSSITTSAVTPMVGVGLIGLRKVAPIVHGANIGTCITGIMAAMVSSNRQLGMRVALAHLFFNLCGLILWYVIWPMRRVPTWLSVNLAIRVGRFRPLAIVYLVVVFGLIPLIAFGVSIVGWQAQLIVLWMLISMALYASLPTINIYDKHGSPDHIATMSKHRMITLGYFLLVIITPVSLWLALSAISSDIPLIVMFVCTSLVTTTLLALCLLQRVPPQWLPSKLRCFPWVYVESYMSFGTLKPNKAQQMVADTHMVSHNSKVLDSSSTPDEPGPGKPPLGPQSGWAHSQPPVAFSRTPSTHDGNGKRTSSNKSTRSRGDSTAAYNAAISHAF
eukprot:gene11420-2078_t